MSLLESPANTIRKSAKEFRPDLEMEGCKREISSYQSSEKSLFYVRKYCQVAIMKILLL